MSPYARQAARLIVSPVAAFEEPTAGGVLGASEYESNELNWQFRGRLLARCTGRLPSCPARLRTGSSGGATLSHCWCPCPFTSLQFAPTTKAPAVEYRSCDDARNIIEYI